MRHTNFSLGVQTRVWWRPKVYAVKVYVLSLALMRFSNSLCLESVLCFSVPMKAKA